MTDPSTLIAWITLALVAAVAFLLERRRHARARRLVAAVEESGRQEEAPSIHPRIDVAKCIGCGSCVEACPEGDALVVADGRARLIRPSHCVGHGRCEQVCPTGALTLVFGTAERGVTVPLLDENLQTSVPGIHAAGELSGFGLIRTAVSQGVRAAERLASSMGSTGRTNGGPDIAIIGAGPAGLAAALACRERGISHVVLDQEGLGGSILHYPRRKLVLTAPVRLPVVGEMNFREVDKESLLAFWQDAVRRARIEIRAPRRVVAIDREDRAFRIRTPEGDVHARGVILAVGRRGTPRRLGVSGEDGANVAYRLLEPEPFAGRRVLVVGGGNSAIEAALALLDAGARTRLAHRGDSFTRLADANQRRLDRAVQSRTLEVHLKTQIRRIEPAEVTLDVEGRTCRLENDDVFIFAGGELPTAFLERLGVATTTYFGEPPRPPAAGKAA
ncbi:MAG TPA: NAD(P)-binding domain-containing protein [Candidatus Eisenbacteria bacterium]|nr:NAD(P)-binding domain-containing protein [Candidatus Eisenbacteria bacterium]